MLAGLAISFLSTIHMIYPKDEVGISPVPGASAKGREDDCFIRIIPLISFHSIV